MSAKELKMTHADIGTDLTISYKILNFFSVFLAISEYVKCKECDSDIQFLESGKRGLGFKLVLKCAYCEEKYIDSCPLISKTYDINRRFIFVP